MSMFVDWLVREGGAILSWWLLTLFAGVAVYPLFFRLAGALPSRGYALARAAGLMLVGFVFWILNIIGLLQNSPGSTLVAALIVLIVGLVSYATWRDREPIIPWLRSNLSLIITTEILFAVMFLVCTPVGALTHSWAATETLMKMAFLSAIRRSATFPPHDPWMSGYAISYYHFGYIIIAMLANLSGVTNGVAFNLALPLLFALTGTGAFGVAYDLVVARLQHRSNDQANDQPTDQVEDKKPERTYYPQALAVGVLAAVFAVVMGNLGTVLVEMPYQTCALPSGYFRWMDLDERDNLPQSQGPDGSTICGTSKSLDPSVWSNSSYYWWWFRYSRVIRDNNLDGTPIGVQPISEFPQFSFMLADMHPHVLALPFAVLAIGLAFNLVLHKRELDSWELLLYAIFVGGMIFLNSWDAVYLGLIVGAEALRRLLKNGTGRLESADWWGLLRFGLALVGLSASLYLPFFLSFRSQAGGILPNVIWPTQFQQFFIMFGPFLVMIAVFLAVEWWRAGATFNARQGLRAVGGLLLVLLGVVVLICLAFILLAVTNPDSDVVHSISSAFGLAAPDPLATTALRLGTATGSFIEILGRRLQGFLTEGFLLVVMFVVVARLFARAPQTADGEPAVTRRVITYSPATGFALLLIAAGAVLTLPPDFVFLRDDFCVRIHTGFNLFYQGWVLWSVACAYGLWSVVFDRAEQPAPTLGRRALGAATVVLVGMCLVYPIYAITSRTFAENGPKQ